MKRLERGAEFRSPILEDLYHPIMGDAYDAARAALWWRSGNNALLDTVVAMSVACELSRQWRDRHPRDLMNSPYKELLRPS